MGLKKAAGEFFVRRWLKDAEQGKEGSDVQKLIAFFRAHKRETSGALAALGVYLASTGHEAWAANLGYVVTFLAGAGFVDSDATHKAK